MHLYILSLPNHGKTPSYKPYSVHNLSATARQLSVINHVFSSLVQFGGKMIYNPTPREIQASIEVEMGNQAGLSQWAASHLSAHGLIPGSQPTLTPPAQPAAAQKPSKAQQ